MYESPLRSRSGVEKARWRILWRKPIQKASDLHQALRPRCCARRQHPAREEAGHEQVGSLSIANSIKYSTKRKGGLTNVFLAFPRLEHSLCLLTEFFQLLSTADTLSLQHRSFSTFILLYPDYRQLYRVNRGRLVTFRGGMAVTRLKRSGTLL